jgi:hypothetical protein
MDDDGRCSDQAASVGQGSTPAEPITVTFEFTKDGFDAAQRATLRLMPAFRIMAAAAALVAVVGILTLFEDGDGGLTFMGVLYLLLIAAWYGFLPKWRWAREPLIRGTQRYTFGEEGVRFMTPVSDATVDWSFFTRAVEYNRFYLLFAGRRGSTPIPKRAFDGPTDEWRFRELVARHLPVTFRNR